MRASYILLVVTFFSSSVFAGVVSEGVQKQIVQTAGEVAKAAINKNKTETTILNSNLKNEVDIQRALVTENTGIEIKGDKIKVMNTKMDNKVKINEAAVLGNSGIKVGN